MPILSDISKKILMAEDELLQFSFSCPMRYKKFYIKKRNSDNLRLIAQPSKQVKFLQRLIVEDLEKIAKIHKSSMAYRVGSGIRENAEAHKNCKFMLKIDFKNFFPSITSDVFIDAMLKQGVAFEGNDRAFLTRTLFWKLRRNSKLRLSIGAPSSPFVSNAVMYIFDEKISNYCLENGIVYTRYADDLTFSTRKLNVLDNVQTVVCSILREDYNSQLKINKSKTSFITKGFNRFVTGVTINNDDEISLGRSRKRMLSSLVHRFKLGLLSPEDTKKLSGYLAFAKYIEPEFIDRISKKYGDNIISEIKKS